MEYKVLIVTSMVHPIGEDILQNNAKVIKTNDYSKSNLLEILSREDIDAILVRAQITIDKEIIERANDVKLISVAGAGVDNIDVDAATKKGIAVLYLPRVNTTSVAEHALALIMALAKNILPCDKEMRNGNFAYRNRVLNKELKGKTLGLIGMGAIGSKLGKLCQNAFNMKLIAFDPYVAREQALRNNIELVSELKELLTKCDIISMHVPLNSNTRNMISKNEIELMKTSAILINTSRGGIIDEKALANALANREIAGAGLDVFEDEPAIDTNSLLFKLDNVVLSPHNASLTEEATKEMSKTVASNVLDFLNGNIPETIFNPEVLTLK